MNQIYSERVLINGSDPQPLQYQILIFLGIDLMLNAFLYAFIFGLSKSGIGNGNFIMNSYKIQYTISLFIMSILSYLISIIMYNKKYFLYKDDGLRAIRALQLIMFRCGTFLTLVPIFILYNK
tara:strand:+ start:254 stop:622 length:369 start_codon:yes stop_codon:yes gene_type:complete